MQILHTSPAEITKIHSNGVAGDCLFFTAGDCVDDAYSMSQCETIVYSMDIEDDKIIEVCFLDDQEIADQIAELFDVEDEEAWMLLDGRMNGIDTDSYTMENDWALQGLRGECAKKMGYDACEDTDEQGTVYIVPMTGLEDRLTKIGTAK
jgi:hypothetical protein